MPRATTKRSGAASGKRLDRLEARISTEQKRLFRRAAELQGRTLTDFVVHSAHEVARRVVEENEIVHLRAQESRAFANALLHPKKPSLRLRAAAKRYLETIGA